MSKHFSDLAVQYAKSGIRVFPCDPVTKQPLTRNGFKNATTDTQKIRRWWNKTPDALIAADCENQFMVVDCDLKNGGPAFESLGKIHKYVSKTDVAVTTMSSGSHYYFKYDETVSRRIKVLHSVDILGKGGYVILPDDSRYQQSGSIEKFIESVSSLPTLDEEFVGHIRGSSNISELSEVREHQQKKVTASGEFNAEPQVDEVAVAIQEATKVSHNKMYERVGKNAGYEEINFNGEPIKIERGSMTSKRFNSIYHNREVQKRIATHMGVPVPSNGTGRSRTFKSTLPSHSDDNPSMACRWVTREGKGSYIAVRDFSDHYGNGKTDYNLTRLYMVSRYGKNYKKPSPTEFYVWSMKLMEEAGVIELESPEFDANVKHFTDGESKVANGFLTLLGIKNLWKGGSSETCYSQKFAAAWSGVSTATVNSMKSKAIRFGVIEKTGETHGSAAMRTPIFKLGAGVIKREEITTIHDLIYAVNSEVKRKKEPNRFLTGSKSRQSEKVEKTRQATASRNDVPPDRKRLTGSALRERMKQSRITKSRKLE